MNVLNFTTSSCNPCLGLVVLQSDLTIEDEFRFYFNQSDASILVNRIPFENAVTIDTLKAMQHHLQATMDLFPIDITFNAVGYGCTSGALHIGNNTIKNIISSRRDVKYVSNPMQAAIEAMKTIKAQNIGYLSPYSKQVSQTMIDEFNRNNFHVKHAATFNEPLDRIVGNISPQSIYDGVLFLAERGNIDAIFISCTNMKTASIIAKAEHETGLKIVSSNQALAWHMAQLAGITINIEKGSLFQFHQSQPPPQFLYSASSPKVEV